MKKDNQYFTVDEIKHKLERYCVYQDRCHAEVEKKLNEYRLIAEARDLILLHLLQNDFLNEERFARSFARGKFRIKKWGRVRITRELKLRKLSTYNIKAGLSEIDDDEYLCTLNGLFNSQNEKIKETNSFKKKKKLFNYLYRKGYESDLIYDLLNKKGV